MMQMLSKNRDQAVRDYYLGEKANERGGPYNCPGILPRDIL